MNLSNKTHSNHNQSDPFEIGQGTGNAAISTAYSQPEFNIPLNDLGDLVEQEQPRPPALWGLTLGITLTLAVLGAQTFRLQVTEGTANRSLAEGNSVRILTVSPDRGLITDINHTVLAQNNRQLALAIDPRNLPVKKSDRNAVYELLKQRAGIDAKTIALIENNRLLNPDIFPIKTRLSKDESLLYKDWFANTPGVITLDIPIRDYLNLPSLGQLIGYVGSVNDQDLKNGYTLDQHIGKGGLESIYNKVLTGNPGKEKAVVDASGQVVQSVGTTLITPVEPGKTLRLSLDNNLQNITAEALKHELERRTKEFGPLPKLGAAAVILDPSTGAIKAMVSLPDYNNQPFAKGISQDEFSQLLNDPGNPLLNRAIQGVYPPGSTIKPSIAAAALQNGVIGADTQIYTPASIKIGDFIFPDWKLHGNTNLRKAIAESNDIYFYTLGGGWEEKGIKGLGIDRMNQFLAKFGFGKTTGIDLPGENAGLLPDPVWKQKVVQEPWYIGDTYHSSIGQGFTLATPLQMAVSVAAVANGGTVWQPQLAWSTIDPTSGQEDLLPHQIISKDFVSPANIQAVREGMRQTVQSGSGHPLNTLKVASAGKTGTAQFGLNNEYSHAWYTGFAPYDNPEIAFAIIIEGGGESFYSSLPVAEEILRNYFHDPLAPGQKLNSEPDLTNIQATGEH